MAEAHERDAVVANIGGALRRARAAGAPVVWVQHSDDEHLAEGSEAWEYVDGLVRDDAEPLMRKRWADAFEDTDLEERLAQRGVGHLAVAGASTDVVHPRAAAASISPLSTSSSSWACSSTRVPSSS